MTIKKLLGTAFIALAVMATSDYATAATATPQSIIVMPARKRVVQLAFQMSRCKDIGMVTYNNSPALATPLIHVWTGSEWVQITIDEFVQGTFMTGEPKHVFLLGDNTIMPAQMMDAPSWCKDTHKITSLDTAALINQIGKVLKFSSRQWTWLAQENGLSVKDENAERRRYGRWGAPGKERDLKPTKLESIELPPAAPITIDVKSETIQAPPAPVFKEIKTQDVETKVEKVEPPKPAKPTAAPKVEYKIEKQSAPAVGKPEVTPAPAAPTAEDDEDEGDCEDCV